MRAAQFSGARFALALVLGLVAAPAPAQADSEAVSPPPGARPIQVEVGFFLLNLISVDERSETFDADIYLNLRWSDPRLAFPPQEHGGVLIYQGDSAADRVEEIWWPDLEFVNTATPEISNRTLEVRSDGTVSYRLGLTATFRTPLDLRTFPFDSQDLVIRLQSFEGDRSLLVLAPDPDRLGFTVAERYAGLAIQGVHANSRVTSNPGWQEDFSELELVIHVERSPGFFIWTVFVPVGLVLLLCCTIFFVDIHNFHDRVAIALACFLACIATQFAMSFNLPQISYLTPIDRLFLVTYSCMALAVAMSVVQQAQLRHDVRAMQKTDRLAAAGIPILYALLLFFVVLPST